MKRLRGQFGHTTPTRHLTTRPRHPTYEGPHTRIVRGEAVGESNGDGILAHREKGTSRPLIITVHCAVR